MTLGSLHLASVRIILFVRIPNARCKALYTLEKAKKPERQERAIPA
jgi:hypothetical protein